MDNYGLQGIHRYLSIRSVTALLCLTLLLLLSSCTSHIKRHDGAPDFYVDETKIPNAVPKREPLAKLGNMPSYVVFGKRYYTMRNSANYEAVGTASWYGTMFHTRSTSSGEPYDMLGMTAAHKTLPLPTYVEVTNLKNNRTIIVKVNDRGPFESNRLIDLSYVAAKKLGMLGHGTATVKIKALDPSSWQPANDFMFASNNNVNPHPEFVANTPLKRTYTYYLQHSRRLSSGAIVAKNNPSRQHEVYEKTTVRHYHHSQVTYASNTYDTAPKVNHQKSALYFQVGAFRNKSHAIQLQRRLNTLLGTQVNISHSGTKNALYHVKVGPFKDVASAKRISNRLRGLGIKSNKI